MCDQVVLWQRHIGGGDLRCTISQIGEGEFELRLWAGRTLLLTEDFEAEDRLLDRARELELDARGDHS
jgi:hypothetical protein